jgi:hypothetical protein
MDLMQELRLQAEALQKAQATHEAKREELVAAVETAMARAFKYFHELLKHLEVVKPANPTSYVIPQVGSFEGLTFRESFIDFRKKREADVELYHTVHFFIRWASDANLVVELDSQVQVQRVRDALWTCNVRYSEDEVRSSANPHGITITVPRNIVTDIEIRADHEQSALVFSTRNLMRLGPEDFKVPARDAGKEVFDELGRMLLGQRSNFTKYRTSLAARTARP